MQTKMCKVAIAKAEAIEHLDVMVDAFGKAITMTTIEETGLSGL